MRACHSVTEKCPLSVLTGVRNKRANAIYEIFVGTNTSSETQGQSVGGGRNGATKVFNNGRKNPWVPSLTGPFPNGFANTGS